MQVRVSIKQKSGMVLFRGRNVRTPVDILMSQDEFKLFEMQLRARNITEYTVNQPGEKLPEKQSVERKVPSIEQDPVIEELEPMSILDKLASEGGE